MPWSARQYTAFESERTRPVRDLVAAIPTREVRRAMDLGSGPGNSTEVLAARYPAATIEGLDNSPDMLASARRRMPSVTFHEGDIATWRADVPYDVVLANASLQWVPDHATLYPRLLAQVAPGGSLAVQTPDNEQEPAHVLLHEVAEAGPWAARLAGIRPLHRHAPTFYYALLSPLARVDVWRTTYHHPLASHDAVVEWFKGSRLGPYLAALGEGEARDEFLRRYRQAIAGAYPALPDGTVLLPFPRVFVVATR